MAKNIKIAIPIICENIKCSNFGSIVNTVTGLNSDDADLFYEGYNGSEKEDYCPICKELAVAEDYYVLPK